MSASRTLVLRLQDVTVAFRRQGTWRGVRTQVVHGVSLQVHEGETLGIVGESGSGKSTIARVAVRGLAATASVGGSAEIDGEDVYRLRGRRLRRLRRRSQMVFQDPNGSLNPRMTAGTILDDVLRVATKRDRRSRAERTDELLRLVGLDPRSRDKYPHEFSGGQRQRIAIARALAAEPRLLVCDEPVAALDVSIQGQVLNLLIDVQERLGLTIVFISHDIGVVRHMSDRIAVMYLGRVVEQGDADEVYFAPRHPYTAALLASVSNASTDHDTAVRTLVIGDAPQGEPDGGCAFRSRCWLYAQLDSPDVCRTDRPELVPVDSGESACHFAEVVDAQRMQAGAR
ncbi:oligopeptide/dipeptide ABC transporter ATP-binding protein [Microbacterium ulmi]|uniref:ATP-binding cassette domain-containing protein n=1 Tax=Microbacterium ulmi TaxID=179095 RepID=A0A7Y2LYI1_9MICO|nr:oligopeptide/dipeptide ABC transporter ATP-binding protein [Microbacterium ulmi]NII68353.1 oligopeptide/dipeptide ABC transporter ATP-binding protein [Microbacterium ulmi]NNH03112.1 ATP-binding cassette domain-containing protein [Microbacterium ulmi]